MEFLQDLFSLLGRVCLSGMILWTCYEQVRNWGVAMSYIKSKHVPRPDIALPVQVGLKALGGLMILFGWHAHFGALLLLVIICASAWFLHAFWKRGSGAEQMLEKALFMKELAIIGGLFLVLAVGAGHFGIGG